ncbi:MAG: ABC transporter ATP-binding protein, partial [Henriciella sp.]|nr:ABC transporter ATP-binding protein [Henriciella sp.]
EATAEELWLVKDGRAVRYDGNLADYRNLVLQADRGGGEGKKKKGKNKRDAEPAPEKVDKSQQRRAASDARKAAAPLRRKVDEAEKLLEATNRKIARIDLDMSQPDHGSEKIQIMMRRRGELISEAEQAELEWLEASEAYEKAIKV